MSGQLRVLKNRIRSVESTQKITRAMEMVATAKLKRFQGWMQQSAPYQQALDGILARLLQTDLSYHHPLLNERKEKRCALVLITSDTGLCGSYNHELIEAAKNFLRDKSPTPLLIGFGKSGVNGLSRAGYGWHAVFKDTKIVQLEDVLQEISRLINALFCEQKVDAVYALYSRLVNKTVFHTVVEKLLPLRLAPQNNAGETSGSYIIEPDPAALFEKLIPRVFEAKVRMDFLEALVTEQTARMNAMRQATENAAELIDTLILLRNKVRQAAITNELIEIISGSQALKQ